MTRWAKAFKLSSVDVVMGMLDKGRDDSQAYGDQDGTRKHTKDEDGSVVWMHERRAPVVRGIDVHGFESKVS